MIPGSASEDGESEAKRQKATKGSIEEWGCHCGPLELSRTGDAVSNHVECVPLRGREVGGF